MTKELGEYRPEEEHIFVEHIRRHLWEMDVDDKRPYCKICNKPIDEIVKEESMKGIWTAGGIYFPAYEYIDKNGKKFKIVEL